MLPPDPEPLHSPPQNLLKRISSRHGELLIFTGLIGLFFSCSCWISSYCIRNFLSFLPGDSGVVNQSIWNALHGRMWDPQTLYDGGHSLFCYHFFPSLLLLLPVYALAPKASTIFLLKNAIVIGSAIPVYLLVRHLLSNSVTRLLICGTYLLTPFVSSLCHSELNLMIFAVCPLVACYYFYVVSKFRAFLVCALIAMFTTENFPLVFMVWGLVGLIDRRDRRWTFGIIAIAVICFISALWIPRSVCSALGHPHLDTFKEHYGAWGDTLGSCLLAMLSRPIDVLAYLTEPSKWFYLFYIGFPFFPFVFLRPKFLLLSAPNILVFFLMSGRHDDIYNSLEVSCLLEVCLFSFMAFLDFIGPSFQKSSEADRRLCIFACISMLVAFAWFAIKGEISSHLLTVIGIDGLSRYIFLLACCAAGICVILLSEGRSKWRLGVPGMTIAFLLLIVVFRGGLFCRNLTSVESYFFKLPHSREHQHRSAVAAAALDSVPRDRWLVVPTTYFFVASSRPQVSVYDGQIPITALSIYSSERPEYAFLDLNDTRLTAIHWAFQKRNVRLSDRSFMPKLLNEPGPWKVIFHEDGLYLLKRDLKPTLEKGT